VYAGVNAYILCHFYWQFGLKECVRSYDNDIDGNYSKQVVVMQGADDE